MKKLIYPTILLVLFSLTDIFGQKGSLTVSFVARDFYTHDTLSLDSVFVENPARNCDTTIYGGHAKLMLVWAGIDELTNINGLQLAQNYPNPFAGSTRCTLKLQDKKNIKVTLTNVHGKQLATLQKTLACGTHTFTIKTSAGGIYFLKVSDGNASKTLKLNSIHSSGKNNFSIYYSGNEDLPESSKKNTQNRGFTFLPGDVLNMTGYTSGYEGNTLSAAPLEDYTAYFTTKPNYLSLHADSTWGYVPIHASFSSITNIPNLTSWHWDFGDGETSDLQYPTHNYTTPGTYYTVTLTVQGDFGNYSTEKVSYIHTLPLPAGVDFVADITDGMAPMDVHFVAETNIPNPINWVWSFGDGNGAQHVQNPYHNYQDIGVYTVTLQVYDNNGVTSKTKEDYIYVNYCPSTVTDADGNVYNTIAIGSQCWMQENLNVGTKINSEEAQNNNGVLEKYCFNNSTSNCNTYGGLYQWGEYMQYDYYTEGVQGICPNGWHIPTYDDFWKLICVAGTVGTSGGSLKETMYAHWDSPNTGADNLTGFTALGAGYFEIPYINDPWWSRFKIQTRFGTSTSVDVNWTDDKLIRYISLQSSFGEYSAGENWILDAVSIRCVKDQSE